MSKPPWGWGLGAVALMLTACSDGDGGPDPEGSTLDDGAPADSGLALAQTAAMFEPDRVISVEIEMAPEDFASLRAQTRSLFDVIGGSCLSERPERPFSYFPATVSIDGEVVEEIGVRKKGFFGSLSTDKPSLKLKFSEYRSEQRHSGLKRMTLNNAIQDASYVKQCLGYALFAAAGVPAPRCNFAHVSVNGEDLGAYVHVESIKKQFLSRYFDDNDGNLYEGALSDFRPGWIETFQRKTNELDADRSDIETILSSLEAPEASRVSRLGEVVDLDAFATFWAAEVLLMHADGYARNTNNFYLYANPDSGRFHFVPWGIDSILFPDAALPWEGAPPEPAVWVEGALSCALYDAPETRERYYAELSRLLAEVWDETQLRSEIDRMVALIEPFVPRAEALAFRQAAELVRQFVRTRRGALEAALERRPEAEGPLREPWCIEPIGTVSASFDTRFGNLDDVDVLGSSAALSVSLRGDEPAFAFQTSAAGFDDEGRVAVRLLGQVDASDYRLLQVSLTAPENFAAGASIPVDWADAIGLLIRLDTSLGADGLIIDGLVSDGVLELEAASTEPGAPVRGTLRGGVAYESFL